MAECRRTRPPGEGCCPRGGWWPAGGEQAGGRPPAPLHVSAWPPAAPTPRGLLMQFPNPCPKDRPGFLPQHSPGPPSRPESSAPDVRPGVPVGSGRGQEARPLRGGGGGPSRQGLPGDEGTVAPEVPSAVRLLGVQGTSWRVGHGGGRGVLRPRLWARCHPICAGRAPDGSQLRAAAPLPSWPRRRAFKKEEAGRGLSREGIVDALPFLILFVYFKALMNMHHFSNQGK